MVVQVENVFLSYGEKEQHQALADVSLEISQGQSWALIGPSGCGKSSLLFLLAGLRFPQQGKVEVLGKPVTGPREDVALIIQDYGLLPWKTCWENVALGLKLRGQKNQQQKSVVTSLLAALGLAGLGGKYPSELSGGQRQRVAVARALALEPSLLLMDEPFSALDALTREKLQEMVLDIWRRRQMTLVFVTHSIEEAVYLGQKIAVFSPQPGRISTIIDNAGAGEQNYRATEEFYRQCNRIRQVLEGNNAETA